MARSKTIRAAREAKAPRAKRAKKANHQELSSSPLGPENEVQEELTLESAARKAYRVLNHYALDDSNVDGLLEARRALKQTLGE
jgi:hypothetical protein